MAMEMMLVSSLEKMQPDVRPHALKGGIEGFLNETVSFQAAWHGYSPDYQQRFVRVKIDSPIAEHISVRHVGFVPLLFPTYDGVDDYYVTKKPGLIEDILHPVYGERFHVCVNRWAGAWFTIEGDSDIPAGTYPITVELRDWNDNAVLASTKTEYRRLNALLPEQKLIRTQWFHNDGLCRYYNVKMFSEDYWRICENFVRTAVKRGINCILTPIHTPPLDTDEGLERLTCQLVDVTKDAGSYTFGFEKLARWVEMCKRCGVRYFEMAHLFTQWGARHAPKIMATVNGRLTRIFGWETEAAGSEYRHFLSCYLPALTKWLKDNGIADNTLFHISDEPSENNLESYKAAAGAAKPYLKGFRIIDALSCVDYYKSGLIEHPVPGNNQLDPFLKEGVKDLWTYYCCGQSNKVSNAFIAMPAPRTRIIGVQMFKYDIAGFLQWGYNFYNTQGSVHSINPFYTTDCDGFTPAGDAFIVYPGEGGEPLETIRLMSMDEAMNDMRALELLARKKGREAAKAVLEKAMPGLTFENYPHDRGEAITAMRAAVNAEIMKD